MASDPPTTKAKPKPTNFREWLLDEIDYMSSIGLTEYGVGGLDHLRSALQRFDEYADKEAATNAEQP